MIAHIFSARLNEEKSDRKSETQQQQSKWKPLLKANVLSIFIMATFLALANRLIDGWMARRTITFNALWNEFRILFLNLFLTHTHTLSRSHIMQNVQKVKWLIISENKISPSATRLCAHIFSIAQSYSKNFARTKVVWKIEKTFAASIL